MPRDLIDPIPVSAAQVAEWLDAGRVWLIDVREAAEYAREFIAGALLMPLSAFEAERVPVPGDLPLVVHCAVGKRSQAAARMLLGAGHSRVLHLEGGLDAWKAAGLPTELALEA